LLKLAFLISKDLNITQEAVQFYVANGSGQNLQEVNKRYLLVELAKTYWQVKSGFALCELTEMIDRMSLINKQLLPHQSQNSKLSNVIYFSIDYRKLIPR